MLNFFDTIISYFKILFYAIVNLFEGLSLGLSTIISSQNSIVFIMEYMPAIISASFTIFILLYVLKFLVGR